MIIHKNAVASVLVGDCLTSMRRMGDATIQMCVTSPPYFGLRDYGHEGQIGLEQTPDEYVAKLVEVFREVRRVLRDDGTLWLNLGDSYAAQRGGTTPPAETLAGGINGRGDSNAKRGRKEGYNPDRNASAIGLKHKDMIGIPWMVAFALRADGWYLRQGIIWHKPNPMPESVTDRFTKSHEDVFLLTKSARYYFDHEAVKEPAVGGVPGNRKPGKAIEDDPEKHRTRAGLHSYAERQRSRRDSFKRAQTIPGQSVGTHRADRLEDTWDTEKRNRRSVWTIATRPYKGAHFATFPPALIEPCILAGSRVGDMVFDPFGGSGTTAGVALKHGRHAMLCELNQDYANLIPARVDSIVNSK